MATNIEQSWNKVTGVICEGIPKKVELPGVIFPEGAWKCTILADDAKNKSILGGRDEEIYVNTVGSKRLELHSQVRNVSRIVINKPSKMDKKGSVKFNEFKCDLYRWNPFSGTELICKPKGGKK